MCPYGMEGTEMAKGHPVWRQSGTSGEYPYGEGAAANWWSCAELLSVQRMVLMTHLCRDGMAHASALGRAYGYHHLGVYTILRAWERQGLVESVQGLSDEWNGRNGHRPTVRWFGPTEWGRRCLWRMGWVNRQMVAPRPHAYPLREDGESDAVEGLRRWARPEFLRPLAMAIAYELTFFGPNRFHKVAEWTQLPPGSLPYYLLRWKALGWVVKAVHEKDSRDWMPVKWQWKFTEAGRLALARHVDALRRAALASGYVPALRELRGPGQSAEDWAALSAWMGEPEETVV